MPFAFWPRSGPRAGTVPTSSSRPPRPTGVTSSRWAVARLTGIPWVADFRDEWAANPHLAGQPRILTASPGARSGRSQGAPHGSSWRPEYFAIAGVAERRPRRVEIVNGVDEDDLAGRRRGPPADRFVLAHVGSLYDLRDPAPVLRCTRAACRARGIARGQARGTPRGQRSGYRSFPPRRVSGAGHRLRRARRAVAEMARRRRCCSMSRRTISRPRGSSSSTSRADGRCCASRPSGISRAGS